MGCSCLESEKNLSYGGFSPRLMAVQWWEFLPWMLCYSVMGCSCLDSEKNLSYSSFSLRLMAIQWPEFLPWMLCYSIMGCSCLDCEKNLSYRGFFPRLMAVQWQEFLPWMLWGWWSKLYQHHSQTVVLAGMFLHVLSVVDHILKNQWFGSVFRDALYVCLMSAFRFILFSCVVGVKSSSVVYLQAFCLGFVPSQHQLEGQCTWFPLFNTHTQIVDCRLLIVCT